MRLMLPMSDLEKQTLLQRIADALQFGRLYAIREESCEDGALVVSAKFSDSFGFVDHPRLTTLQPSGELVDFRCDCGDFRRTHSLCGHCAALADAFFQEVCMDQTLPEEIMEEAPAVPLYFQNLPSSPPVENISYTFCNCQSDLYPGKAKPRIPLARYYQMYGNNALARMLHSHVRRWGGSCFGMTTTAAMFFLPEDPVTVEDFRANAVYAADLQLTSRSKELHMTLHTFIECMQISQYHNDLIQIPRSARLRDPNCLDELCQRVLHFQQTESDPVCISIYRSRKYDGGHSVLPFWLDTTESGQTRIHIYDPNHPMTTRYAYLDKDENGHYTNWRFPMFDDVEYSGATGGQIAFNDYADFKQVWNERGGEKPTAMMSVPRGVAIADGEGNVLFRVTAEGTESFCDDIYQVLLTDLGEETDEQVMLTLPAGNYLIRNEDPRQESVEITLSHTQQSITVRTNASEVEIMADDTAMAVSARIAQADRSYCIELDVIFEDDSHNIQLEGVTAEGGLTFGCYDGILRAEGTLDETAPNFYIDEELSDLSCIECKKVVTFQEEPVPEKVRKLITCTELPDVTD